jgi:uncharacterized protein
MPTTLAAGDIAFLSLIADSPDTFSFVLLKDIDPGTIINITDNGWLATGGLRTGEGILQYVAPTALPIGTVLTYIDAGPNLGWTNISGGTAFSLSASGDSLIAFQGALSGTGTTVTSTAPTVIAALTINRSTFDADAINSNTTALPTGLTLGTNAVAVGQAAAEFDNSRYSGPTAFTTVAAARTAINTASNWTGSDTDITNFSGTLTIGGTVPPIAAPTVNLSVSSTSGSEANTTAITVTATASSAVTGNQTVTLGVTGTGITASDYYLTRNTITIPTGQTSGSVTFIVADDTIAEGAETAVLTIGTPSSGLTLGTTIAQNITIANNDNSFLNKVGNAISTNGAEIPAFDPASDRLFVVAGTVVETYTVTSTGTLTAASPLAIGFTPPTGTAAIPNSVAAKNGIVAVAYAVQNTTTNAQQAGRVSFYNAADGAFLNSVEVGFLPDMLTFTPDGTKVLVANEGEPNSYGVVGTSFDPEGSVSVINIAGGVASATVQNASFTSFNSQLASLKASGVRIIGPGSTVAQDLEPEYIAIAPDGLTARITLQENNAIAILDIATATITSIQPLGVKDHSLTGNGFDASDWDLTSSTGKINIQNWPVVGLYQPDAISSFTANGQTYYITANEGDSRSYTGFNEEIRVNAAGYVLDPTKFPNATNLKLDANLGRLQLTNATGDTDGDGDFDRIEAFGSRSFSIWNSSGVQVFDSGDQLERITAAQTPTLFNSDGLAATFDTRSDNKGPEPEGVVTGVINNRTYAFIGIERSGDVMVYDVSNPIAPQFIQYINTPEDIATEGLTFVSATDSPTGKPLLITANEISKTVGVFEITAPAAPTLISQIQGSGTTATPGTFTIEGIVVGDFQGTNQLGGFYLQEENSDADTNVLTSEGIFVNSLVAVNFGDKVRVTGTVQENTLTPSFGQATITPGSNADIQILGTGLQGLVTPTIVDLPTVALGDLERYEGMLVTFPETLTVTETFNLGRFGEVVLSADGRLFNPTNIIDPNDSSAAGTSFAGGSNVAAVTAQQDLNNRRRIILDDGSSAQNLSDVPYIDTTDANPLNDTLRIGSTVSNLTGVVGFGFSNYRIQATQATTFNYAPRPVVPTVGGNVKVGTFNVLNYFNGDGLNGGFPTTRGADSAVEFTRQRDKIIAAIKELNADVVGLIEIENDGDGANSAIADLVNGLNTAMGAGTYAFVPLSNTTGTSGTDEIKVAFIYKPSAVTTVGNAQYFNDPAFTTLGRPPLAQTFRVNATGETFTPIVNHFKSKSASGATGLDADQGDGQGAFNATRKAQATALLSFVGQIQTTSGDSDVMILGDLNAYNEEDPIDILRAGGFTKLATATDSYVFDGQTGSLDHALVSSSLVAQVTGAAKWNINADEPITLDYNDNVQTTGTNGEQTSELRNDVSLYQANPYRSSDHDPVLVGLNLQSAQTQVIEQFGGATLSVVNGLYKATDKVTNEIKPLTYAGNNFGPTTFAGWSVIGAEIAGTDVKAMWKNTSGQFWYSTNTDNGSLIADAVPYEVTFQQDFNDDGVIGAFTTIEALGTTQLLVDGNNQYIAKDSTGAVNLKYGGVNVGPTSFAEWSVVGTEVDAGTVKAMWKNNSGLFWYSTNTDNGGLVANVASYESPFQQDFNANGIIGT